MNRRFCLTLDLKTIRTDRGIPAISRKNLAEITRASRTLASKPWRFICSARACSLIMEVNEHFSFEAKSRADQSNPKVQEWENMMWRFQQSLPKRNPGKNGC